MEKKLVDKLLRWITNWHFCCLKETINCFSYTASLAGPGWIVFSDKRQKNNSTTVSWLALCYVCFEGSTRNFPWLNSQKFLCKPELNHYELSFTKNSHSNDNGGNYCTNVADHRTLWKFLVSMCQYLKEELVCL